MCMVMALNDVYKLIMVVRTNRMVWMEEVLTMGMMMDVCLLV